MGWGNPVEPPKPAPWGKPAEAPKPSAKPAVEIDSVPLPTGPALNAPKPKPPEPPPRLIPTLQTARLDPMAEGYKPTLDMLVSVVRTYLVSMAHGNMPSSVREPEEWERQAVSNRETLEHNVKVLGFGDLIEWD